MNARRPSQRPKQGRRYAANTRPTRRDEASKPRRTKSGPKMKTRHSLVVPGAKGPRQISLRFIAIAFTMLIAVIGITPTLSKYIEKQQELREVRSELAQVQEHNAELERELALWSDPDFIRTQARERLGYVMPGETLYVVTDPSEGTAKERLDAKVRSVNRERRAATPWYSTMWDSIGVAGQTGTIDNPNQTPLLEKGTGPASDNESDSAADDETGPAADEESLPAPAQESDPAAEKETHD